MNFEPRRASMRAVMGRGALIGLLLTSCARPIGTLSPRELIAAGRPCEVQVPDLLADDDARDGKLVALHQATLLHAGRDFDRAEYHFNGVETAQGYALLPAEQEAFARLRATNALALWGDPKRLEAALPGFAVVPPEPGMGSVVVVFERGAAPRVRVGHDAQTRQRTVEVTRAPGGAPARVEIDDGPAVSATLVDSLAQKWAAQLDARARGAERPADALNPFAQMRDALARPQEWWTPPTDWLVAQVAVSAGKHVVTVSTIAGRRAHVFDVAAGRTAFLVVPQ